MRLTTDTPKGNMESARNLFYIKDGETWVLGGGPEPDYKDVTLYDFVRRITELHGLDIITTDNEAMGEHLCDLLMDNVDTIEGVVALLYTAAWAFSELRERLKAYEDTGLEPEEIKDILERYRGFRAAISDETGQPMVSWTRASQLVRADKEGRMVVLPCKVGETLYTESPVKGMITSFEVPDLVWIIENISEFGKTVFLTRAEAEAAIGGGGDG